MKAIAIKAFEAQTIEDKLGFMNSLSRMLDEYRTDSHGRAIVRQSQTLDDGLDAGLPPWGSLARFPSYPQGLQLVSPQQVGRRRLGSPRGRAELLHAIAHIEWHAIHLALDAALRFESMPSDFFLDWLGVAVEEASHFSMLNQHLQSHYQVSYGDFPAHAGMWDMARQTELDVVARMALVPRVLEARGLDVTPAMILVLRQQGDSEGADCLQTILDEEVRHVGLGSYWYRQACLMQGLEPETHFLDLLKTSRVARVRGVLNVQARQQAGFSRFELDQLALLASPGAGKKSTGVIN
ncbi:MAG: hypothetical protein RIQ49_1769 [Pseudomonadota bacterium]|jgi:uncharacterized ferritin-like protein (DUF455 family)